MPENSEVSYRIVNSSKSKRFIGRDISRGGVRFYVHEFIPKGSVLRLKISPADKSFYFESLVVVKWIREYPRSGYYEIGTEFIDMPLSAVKGIIRLVAKYISGE